MNKYILELNANVASLDQVGGKAHNLLKLLKAGFKVPGGFIVNTEAYNYFVENNQLTQRIYELYTIAESADVIELDRLSKEIKNLILDAPIPDDLAQEIINSYQEMQTVQADTSSSESQSVAVRSSATSEDLPEHSFAGLQDSFLNLSSESTLLNAIKNCWASLWNTRAMAYRKHADFDSSSIGMAIVVQRFVLAEKSGILFTANPVTGSQEEIWINAVWGLGESAVGGKTRPHTLVFNKSDQRIISEKTASQKVMTVPSEQGTVEVPVSTDRQGIEVLNSEESKSLLKIAGKIEAGFGRAQDIEWAIVGDTIYILQTRPITQMDESKEIPGDNDWPVEGEWTPQPFDEWTRANVGELWRDPVSPIVASTVPLIISGAVSHSFHGIDPKFLDQIQWAKRFLGRIYYNEGALRHLLSTKLGLPASVMDKSRGNFRSLKSNEKKRIHLGRIVLHLPILARLARKQYSIGNDLEKFRHDCDQWFAAFFDTTDFQEEDKKLWEEALLWLERTKYALKLQNDMSGFAATAFSVLERLTTKWLNDKQLAVELVSGIPGVQAAEMGQALWKIARKIKELNFTELVLKEDPLEVLEHLRQNESAKPIIIFLEEFLKKHGHRCPNEAEWLHPRWVDQPELVIQLVTGYLNLSDESELKEHEVYELQKETTRVMMSKLNWFQRKIMQVVLHRARHGVLQRDNGKSYAIKASYPARKICSVIGQRWAQCGWLKREEDIYFLTMMDLENVINSKEAIPVDFNFHSLVAERRKAFNYWFTVDAPTILDANGQAFPDEEVEGQVSALQGIAASKGRVRGRVRIIFFPIEALKMKSDEILVTRATDAGWSAVFPIIAGLVTEIGGQLSHAAILAREYRLPAVVNVENASSKLQDGQMITIDGSTGDIFIEDEINENKIIED